MMTTVTTERPAPTPRRRGATTGEAAAALGVSHATLLLWVSEGKVTPAYRTGGGHYRWYIEDLERQVADMIENRAVNDPTTRQTPPPPPPVPGIDPDVARRYRRESDQ